MKRICILLLILYSISIAKFFPAYYSGYQKITKSIALQQLENPLFNNPVDAAIMLPGNVRVTFIVDEGWHRVVYTKENQDDWIKAWGEYGSGDTGMKGPLGCTVDRDLNLYVADCGNQRIVKLHFYPSSDELRYRDAFLLDKQGIPWDVAYWDSSIYVTDCKNHRILKYSTSGELLSAYGSYGSGDGQFCKPQGIAVIRDTIYIADLGNGRMVALKDNGSNYSWLRTRYLTELDKPYIQDVEVDSAGGVYVIDHWTCEIFKFAPGLTELLDRFGNQEDGPFKWPRFMGIRGNNVIVSEQWSNESGIQYYKIRAGVVSAELTSDTIDLTERDLAIWFMLDESAEVSITVKDSLFIPLKILCEDSLMEYGGHQVIWDGKDEDNKLTLPGNYIMSIRTVSSAGADLVNLPFTIKGTKIGGNIYSDTTWIEEGEPYVMIGQVTIRNDSKLTIEPGTDFAYKL